LANRTAGRGLAPFGDGGCAGRLELLGLDADEETIRRHAEEAASADA
jgi:hypothetical protein